MRYRLCDDEEAVTGIAVELAIQAEPFADEVPYRLALHAGGVQVAEVPVGTLTPAELFALGHALLDAAADGFGHFVPADEVFGLDLAPPERPGHVDREVADHRLGGCRQSARRASRREAASPSSSCVEGSRAGAGRRGRLRRRRPRALGLT